MESNDDATKSKDPSVKSPKSSMTPVELNNLVVSLRKTTRKAKVHTIRTLSRQIVMYKKKKGTEKQVQANQKKADRLMEEMKVIKKLDIDWISKFSLYNARNLQDVTNKRLETKSMVRVALAKVLQAKVRVFRAAHSDWQELASFLISKTTGRRFKKIKLGPRKLKPAAHLDLESVQPKTAQQAESGGQVVEKASSESDLNTPAHSDSASDCIKDKHKDNEEEGDNADAVRMERIKVIEDLEMDVDSDDDESSGESNGNDESKEKDEESNGSHKDSDSDDGTNVKDPPTMESDEPGMVSDEPKQITSPVQNPKQKMSSPGKPKEKLKTEISSPAKPKEKVKTAEVSLPAKPKNLSKGLMVIKKFNLEDSPEEENTEDKKDVPFMLTGTEEVKVTDTGIKDSFFQGSDNEESDDEHHGANDASDDSDGELSAMVNQGALDSTFTKSLTYQRRLRGNSYSASRDTKWGSYDRFERGGGRGSHRGRGYFSDDSGRGSGRGFNDGYSDRGRFNRGRPAFSSRGRGDGRGRGRDDTRESSRFDRPDRSDHYQDSNRTKWEKADKSKGNTWPPQDSKKDTSKKELHPSWQASLRKKQEQKIISYQGKKTVFGDD